MKQHGMYQKGKRIISYLAIFKKEDGKKRFYPICPITFKKLKKAEFIYDWGGIVNTFIKISFLADNARKNKGSNYKESTYQVRDSYGNIYMEINY